MKNSAIAWQAGWEVLSSNRLWILSLLVLGSISSVIYAHAPLVAFAVMAGTTLKRRKAFMLAITVWLINQLYGYLLRQFPLTLESLGWGLLMLIGAVLVAGLAALRPQFSRASWSGHLLWTSVAAVVGFALFEGLILLALMTSDHGMDSATMLKLFSKEMIWTTAIALFHRLSISLIPHSYRLRTHYPRSLSHQR
jgi:hypothetical protein